MRIWMVENTDPDRHTPSYAPKSSEVKTKKYWSEAEAKRLYKQLKPKGARLFYADVSDWHEVES